MGGPACTVPRLTLEFPTGFWTLLNVGVGGYIGGRSLEKSIDKWKGNDGPAGQ